MPIWLRRFTFRKLQDHYEKQKEEQEKLNKQLNPKKSSSPAKPNIKPNQGYVAKAPRN